MKKENKLTLYFNMVIGAIGTILIVLFEFRHLIFQEEKLKIDITGNAMIMFGFIFTINYINYLEKKAGISNKLTWIRAIASIIIVVAFYIFFL